MAIFVHQGDIPADLDFGSSVAIDTETTGLNFHRDRLCVVQLSDGNGDAHLVQFPDQDYSAPNLKKLLANKSVTKIFHLALFDVSMLYQYIGVLSEPVYCTKVVSRMVRTYTPHHGLKNLCQDILDIKISKQQQSTDWSVPELSEDQKEYAAADVLYLHDIKKYLDEQLQKEGRVELAQKCFEFLPNRCLLELQGWGSPDLFAYNYQQQ